MPSQAGLQSARGAMWQEKDQGGNHCSWPAQKMRTGRRQGGVEKNLALQPETWAHSLLSPFGSLCGLGSSLTPGSEDRNICFQGLR